MEIIMSMSVGWYSRPIFFILLRGMIQLMRVRVELYISMCTLNHAGSCNYNSLAAKPRWLTIRLRVGGCSMPSDHFLPCIYKADVRTRNRKEIVFIQILQQSHTQGCKVADRPVIFITYSYRIGLTDCFWWLFYLPIFGCLFPHQWRNQDFDSGERGCKREVFLSHGVNVRDFGGHLFHCFCGKVWGGGKAFSCGNLPP